MIYSEATRNNSNSIKRKKNQNVSNITRKKMTLILSKTIKNYPNLEKESALWSRTVFSPSSLIFKKILPSKRLQQRKKNRF